MTARVEFDPEIVRGESLTTAQQFGWAVAKELAKSAAPQFAGALDMFAATESDDTDEMPFAVLEHGGEG